MRMVDLINANAISAEDQNWLIMGSMNAEIYNENLEKEAGGKIVTKAF